MTDERIQSITDEFFASLSNKEIPHPKCLVLFSGVPGSGKTKLAKFIEQELKAVRLSNDNLRNLIVKYNPTIERDERERIKSLVRNEQFTRLLDVPNRLIVLDGSCDREGDFYYSWAHNYDYRVILLRFEVDRQEIERRIVTRGDEGYKKVDRLTTMLDKWWQDWEDFGRAHYPDLIITPQTPVEKVINTVEYILNNIKLSNSG